MTDSDKTIDGFVYWIENEENGVCYIPLNLCKKIMKLLKEQEPIDPVLDYWRPHGGSHFKCGNCGCSIGYAYESRFCKRCGREVRWPHE